MMKVPEESWTEKENENVSVLLDPYQDVDMEMQSHTTDINTSGIEPVTWSIKTQRNNEFTIVHIPQKTVAFRFIEARTGASICVFLVTLFQLHSQFWKTSGWCSPWRLANFLQHYVPATLNRLSQCIETQTFFANCTTIYINLAGSMRRLTLYLHLQLATRKISVFYSIKIGYQAKTHWRPWQHRDLKALHSKTWFLRWWKPWLTETWRKLVTTLNEI